MNLHASAPDCKYMTVEELEENGDWMDQIIDTYKYPRLTRKTIAQKCKMFACADDGKILTLPFYSLFEKSMYICQLPLLTKSMLQTVAVQETHVKKDGFMRFQKFWKGMLMSASSPAENQLQNSLPTL